MLKPQTTSLQIASSTSNPHFETIPSFTFSDEDGWNAFGRATAAHSGTPIQPVLVWSPVSFCRAGQRLFLLCDCIVTSVHNMRPHMVL